MNEKMNYCDPQKNAGIDTRKLHVVRLSKKTDLLCVVDAALCTVRALEAEEHTLWVKKNKKNLKYI